MPPQRSGRRSSTRRAPLDEDSALTATALCVVYQVIMPRLRSPDVARLGMTAPSYARSLTRSAEFLWAIALEMRQFVERVVQDNEASAPDVGLRIEREHSEEAAVALHEIVRRLSTPVREVTVMRAEGRGWREVVRMLPGRAFFSLVDDYRSGLRDVWAEGSDLVRRLT